MRKDRKQSRICYWGFPSNVVSGLILDHLAKQTYTATPAGSTMQYGNPLQKEASFGLLASRLDHSTMLPFPEDLQNFCGALDIPQFALPEWGTDSPV